MNDRELLELAAKAAGVALCHYNDAKNAYWLDDKDLWWNPLTDDGDALRLAVKLCLSMERPVPVAVVVYDVFDAGIKVEEPTETVSSSDPYAATRRAIVRAAAEIGKTM